MPKLTLFFKGRLLDVFHIEEGQTLIGRDEACQISIDSLAVAPTHAKINLDQTSCRIEGMDENFALQVNHNPTASAELSHGDVIQVGKHTLTYAEDAIEFAGELPQNAQAEEPEADAADNTAPPCNGMLQIMNGDHFGRIIPLHRNLTRIGRAGGDCAVIAKRESGYYISYLEGAASPTVNHKPIGDISLLLNDGDLIKVGKTEMQFHA